MQPGKFVLQRCRPGFRGHPQLQLHLFTFGNIGGNLQPHQAAIGPADRLVTTGTIVGQLILELPDMEFVGLALIIDQQVIGAEAAWAAPS